jgi:CRISPR-associated endonuclease/helicase Cas3
MTDLPFTYRDAWAKTDLGTVAMRLPTHCSIAGSVGRTLVLRDQYSWSAGLPVMAACHDVGKCSAPFLSQSTSWMEGFGMEALVERWRRSKIRHECFTQASIAEILEERGLPSSAAQILGAHHGLWQMADLGELDLREWRVFFKAQRVALVELLESEFGPLPAETFSDTQARYLAGAVSVCDWIASNPDFFPYGDDYPEQLRDQLAAKAISRIGLTPAPFKSGLMFEECFGFTPNDMQRATADLPLDRGLYLIEADTGSGKTEAALFLAYRLIAAGAAHGIYFALPTQLASNLILRRVQKALRKFSPSNRGCTALDDHVEWAEIGDLSPNQDRFPTHVGLVRLCHGSAWLEQRNYRPVIASDGSLDGFSWFSSSRRGLLYPFGAGTIDQALLSTLKSVKHSAVRTFGLAGKAVIIDEAHSYDRYTGTLVEKLATQCEELGSPLIILSATLPAAIKQRLCNIFNSGSPVCLDYTSQAVEQKRVGVIWTDESDIVQMAIREAGKAGAL